MPDLPVRSSWTSAPIPINGLLPAAEWAGAGTLAIPGGFLMARNDASFLYVALDLTADKGNDVGTHDYFWFVVDVDTNGAITPNRDLLFSPWPGNPNRLGMWRMLAANTTAPASTGQVIASTTRVGFGPSPHSATPHRIWEIKLALSELSVDLVPSGPPPVVKFGLRMVSSNPGFTFDVPANPLSAFNNFLTIILATVPAPVYPPGTAGLVIGGVGHIPTTKIGADGYATITSPPPYAVLPDEAAFGSTMHFLGNRVTLQSLWDAGARKYRVLRRFATTAAGLATATFAPIRRNWSNFRWTGTTHVLEPFGPDASDMYPLVSPALDYSIKDLLFEWQSANEPDVLHQFKVEFFNASGGSVPSPLPVQLLTLKLDNNPPDVAILDITHNGNSVPACALETMANSSDGIQFTFRAFDAEGDLYSYSLTAEFGNNETATIASDSYASHRNPTHFWQGVASLTVPPPPPPAVPAGRWVPPKTCAYLFRVSATARVTNGYQFPISGISAFRTVTLIVPGPKVLSKVAAQAVDVLPFGFAAKAGLISQGGEPAKLGDDTLKG